MADYSEDPEVNAGIMQQANQQANKFSVLSAVAQMANNKQAAAAAMQADKSQQARYAPVKLGTQGFAMPESGSFVPSPIYLNERTDEREAKKSALEATLQARKDAQAVQISAQRQQAQESNALRMTIATMAQAAAGGRASDRADAKAEKDADKAAQVALGKMLPPGEIRKLSKSEDTVAGFGDLLAGFRDEYGGSYGTSGIKNMIGRNVPGSSYAPQSNWWQNYNDQKNVIRNQLFGSALTASEGKAYDAANVTEGMAPAEIRTRLSQQQAVMSRAQNKILANLGKSGYNTSGFEATGGDGTLPGGSGARPVAPKGRSAGGAVAGGLTAAEQAELDGLRKQLGR